MTLSKLEPTSRNGFDLEVPSRSSSGTSDWVNALSLQTSLLASYFRIRDCDWRRLSSTN